MPTTKLYPSPFGNLGSPTYVFDVRLSTSATEVEWKEIYRLITQDVAVAENTAQCRKMLASGDEKGYTQQKQKSGAYVACAVFDGNGRKAKNLTVRPHKRAATISLLSEYAVFRILSIFSRVLITRLVQCATTEILAHQKACFEISNTQNE